MNYLINTITSWDEPPRARHQIARAVAKWDYVFFIENNKIGWPRISLNKIEPNLTLITPYFPISHKIRYRLPGLNGVYQCWLFSNIIKKIGRNTIHRVINFDFTATHIFSFFKNVIYYCNDDPIKQFQLFEKLFIPYYYFCEKKILIKSKFTVVVSDYLEKVKNARKLYKIYLGVDDWIFHYNSRFNSNSTQIILNYTGFINNRLEVEWIRMIAVDFPEWEIHLVGPAQSRIEKYLNKHSNIIFTGVLRGKNLVESISKCTIAIIPFKDNQRMRTVSANNKFWLYLALGKPVVYRELPYLLNLPEFLIYKASDYQQFIEKIRHAIKDDSRTKFLNRIEYAKRNTWDDRIKSLYECYNK